MVSLMRVILGLRVTFSGFVITQSKIVPRDECDYQ
jgi:hypothetical protein